MASTVQSGALAFENHFQIPVASYESFITKIHVFLDKKDYKGLDTYFHENEFLYRPILEKMKPLDTILEFLLQEAPNDDDCFRAFRLTVMMENKGYSPSWSKICQAMCYLQLGNETDANRLVQQMIDADKTAMEDGNRFIDQLNNYKKIYASTGNAVMLKRTDSLLSRYEEVGSQASGSTTIPFGETKI